MKKILFIILFCAVFLCGCTQSTSGSVDELCNYSWSKTLDGGAEVRLSFDGDSAALTVDSALYRRFRSTTDLNICQRVTSLTSPTGTVQLPSKKRNKYCETQSFVV